MSTKGVSRAGDWDRTVAETVELFGRVDLLANIAGVVAMDGPDTVVGLTEERWDHVVGVDLKGVWLGMRAVIPTMIDQGGGRICNVASMAALRGLPNLAQVRSPRSGGPGQVAGNNGSRRTGCSARRRRARTRSTGRRSSTR
jgi:NAD(P)-dependent dehydrogenase (short-subunit alcohol dehydrogenase family)